MRQCLFNAYRTCSDTALFIPDIDNLCFLFVLDQSYWMFINFTIFSKNQCLVLLIFFILHCFSILFLSALIFTFFCFGGF